MHTVYVPADRFTADLAPDWGRQARELVRAHGGVDALCAAVGVPGEVAAQVAPRVAAKLEREPIEDLRIDFEDGYGPRPDAEEDAEAVRTAGELSAAVRDGRAPAFVGLRFKCFEAATRRRGVRTVDLFLSTLMAAGGLPDGLVLTLPKVSTVSQVEAMVTVCERYERAAGLPAGRLRFEIQVETPQLIVGADGRHPVAAAIAAGRGRVSSLHYGTFDYSASVGVSAAYQSLAHPAADFAKEVMQVAAAGTGVHLSDGSTNVLPVGPPEQVTAAWRLHHDLVRRSLERAYYQGWDLHPGHLPTRFVATFAFYREGFAAAAARLAGYLRRDAGGVLDEPATVRALARYLQRGHACGALDGDELLAATGLHAGRIELLARPRSDTEHLAGRHPLRPRPGFPAGVQRYHVGGFSKMAPGRSGSTIEGSPNAGRRSVPCAGPDRNALCPVISPTEAPPRAIGIGAGSASGGGDPGRHPRLWWLFLLGCLLGVVAYQLTPVGLGRDVIYQLFGLASAAAILIGVRIHRPARRLPWHLMAAGQLIWSIADAVFAFDGTVLGNERFPSPADPVYLAGYPVVAAGIYLLIRGRRPRRDVAGLLDTAIVTVGLGLVAWVLLARPALRQYQDSPAAAVVGVAYPVADMLLLAVMIRLVTTPGGRTRSLRLLIGALVTLVVVDTTATALDLLTFASSDGINFLWLLSYAAWGAAALTPSMVALSEPTADTRVQFTRTRLLALTAAVLVAPSTLVAQQLLGHPPDVWAVALSSVAMFLLVVARMSLSIDQISAANRQREQAQQALAHQAAHDALTGLPNRRQAVELIRRALGRSRRSDTVVGLLFVDLDGFKRVNDTLGHRAGDELLRHVADRMTASVRSGDLVARLGGDEFVVLLEGLDQQGSAVAVAERLITEIAGITRLGDGREVSIGASVGLSVSHDVGTDPDRMLQEADVAVYRAKREGRGRVEVFDEQLRKEIEQRTRLTEELGAAIIDDALVVHYQPILHLGSGGVQGYEALVRWVRPDGSLMQPGDFIPVAEQSDLICDVDTWVLRHATHQLAAWNRSSGTRDLAMAVNLSARHIARPRVVADVRDAIEAAGIEPGQLLLEITETALIDDMVALSALQQLRALGVSVSIDDFGTGYSSIARLEHLPVDIIKIDRRFLDPNTRSAEKFLRLIVQTAHALDLEVIAEGVEDEQQLALLRELHCESAQGYYLGRPVPAERLHPERERHGRSLLRAPARAGGRSGAGGGVPARPAVGPDEIASRLRPTRSRDACGRVGQTCEYSEQRRKAGQHDRHPERPGRRHWGRSGGDQRVDRVLRPAGGQPRSGPGRRHLAHPAVAGRGRRGGDPRPAGDRLRQHHPHVRGAGLRRRRGAGAAVPPVRPLERRGAGAPRPALRRGGRRAHLDLRRGRDPVRGGAQPLLPRARPSRRRRSGVLPGPRLAGHVRPGVPGGPAQRGRPERVPAGEVEGAARPVVVPAPAADAGLLAVPDGVDGHRPDERDLPGPVQPLPAGPRDQGHHRPARLGLSG